MMMAVTTARFFHIHTYTHTHIRTQTQTHRGRQSEDDFAPACGLGKPPTFTKKAANQSRRGKCLVLWLVQVVKAPQVHACVSVSFHYECLRLTAITLLPRCCRRQ